MTNYNDYKISRDALNGMIEDKQEQINELESEVVYLRKSLRILDTEFLEIMEKKEKPAEFN